MIGVDAQEIRAWVRESSRSLGGLATFWVYDPVSEHSVGSWMLVVFQELSLILRLARPNGWDPNLVAVHTDYQAF